MKSDYLLSFFADTPHGKNQKLRWSVTGRPQAIRRLKYCENKKWNIRAAWLSNKVADTLERLV